MTISNQTVLVAYAGDDVTTVFPITQDFTDNSELQVILRSSTGVETVLVSPDDYEITGDPEVATNPGTDVDMVVAPATGETLIIIRSVPITQEGDYISGGPFPAAQHEALLDKITRVEQDLNYKIRRAPKFKVTSTDLVDIEIADLEAEKLLRVNASGDGIEMVDSATLFPTIAWGNITGDLTDQTDLVAALADKADTASLATVATTGSHGDLSGIGTNSHAQIDAHIAHTSNPHSVTKAQVGLNNVDNTADIDKPVSTAQLTAINAKVSNEAYNQATWDGVVDVAPSKNAVRDQLETFVGTWEAYADAKVVDDPYSESGWDGQTSTAPSRNVVRDKFENMELSYQTYANNKVSDTLYNEITWDGVTDIAPSKNAVRDKIEAVITAYQVYADAKVSDDVYDATAWSGVTDVAPSKNTMRNEVEDLWAAIGAVSPVWGSITGTLSDQTDLQNALDLLVPYTGATQNVDLGIYDLTSGNIYPSADGTYALGSSSLMWNTANIYILNDSSGNQSLSPNTRETWDAFAASSMNWNFRKLYDGSSTETVDWSAGLLTSTLYLGSFLDWQQGYWLGNAGHQVDVYNGVLTGGSGGTIDFGTLTMSDTSSIVSLSYGIRILADSTGQISVDWSNRQALANDGATVAFDYSTVGTVDFGNNEILAGMVGIGTSSPTYGIEFVGTGLATDGIRLATSAFGSIPNPGSVSSEVLLNPRGFNMCVDGATIGATYQPDLGIGLANNRTKPLLSLKTQATQGALLIEQGYFGIGTNSPRQSVDVTGSMVVSWADANRIGCEFQNGSQYRMGMAFTTGTRALHLDALSLDTSFVSIRTGTVASPTTRATFNATGITVAGVALTSDGTSSNPSFSFSSDTNTGLYRLGSDNLAVSVGATTIMNATTTGVMIGGGTSAPSTRLQVNTATATSYLRAIKLGAGSTTDTSGQYIEFASSTSDAIGSQIGGGREGASGRSFLRFSTYDGSSSVDRVTIDSNGDITLADGVDFIINATTGTKIATATTQKIGFWNATPIVQPTTAVAAATFTANTSGIANDTATFDGYTIGQVVKALRNAGLLA